MREGWGGGIRPKRLAIVFLALALEMSPAWAADKPHCQPLSALKKALDAQTHYAPLTPGQLNFARGAYIATPPLNGKMPAGDTALLATHDGEPGGVILWMRGPLVCEPTPIPDLFITAMKAVKTGALDPDGNEV
jgi:hypothetical protein